MSTPTQTEPAACTAREALYELLHLVSDPVKDWTDERANRATMLVSAAVRDLRQRPQGQLLELAPPVYEYVEVEGLDAVNQHGRKGWRVHTADPASDWYLLERVIEESPPTPAAGTVWSSTRPAAGANAVPNLVPLGTTHTVTAPGPFSVGMNPGVQL